MSNRSTVGPLGEVAFLNPPLGEPLQGADRIAFVPMAAVDAETGTVTAAIERAYSEVSKGYTPMMSGDVLVAKITPCFENGKIAQAILPCSHGFGSTEFHVVRPRHGKADARYLLHFLRLSHVRLEGERRMTGSAGQRRVPAAFFQELKVPLPSVPEQRRIAAILDQAEVLRAQRRAALKRLDELAKAIFADFFGDVVGNSRKWPAGIALGQVAEIVSGVTKGRNLGGRSTRKVPYLAVANVQHMTLALSNVKAIDATDEEIARYRLRRSDLLLTEGGDPDKLGRGCLWGDELPECIHQNHVFRVRVTDSRVLPLFLNWLVGSERGKRYFLRAAKQTTGIASINMTQLRGFPLLLPPVELQNAFADRIAAIDLLRVAHRASLVELDALFASLQHRAFRGEL